MTNKLNQFTFSQPDFNDLKLKAYDNMMKFVEYYRHPSKEYNNMDFFINIYGEEDEKQYIEKILINNDITVEERDWQAVQVCFIIRFENNKPKNAIYDDKLKWSYMMSIVNELAKYGINGMTYPSEVQ